MLVYQIGQCSQSMHLLVQVLFSLVYVDICFRQTQATRTYTISVQHGWHLEALRSALFQCSSSVVTSIKVLGLEGYRHFVQ